MTTPDGLTAESEARLETWARHLTPDYLDFLRETLVIAEAAAVARHVRETGCEGVREALEWEALRLHEQHVEHHYNLDQCRAAIEASEAGASAAGRP